MIKAVCFFDLDGTLLNGESKVDERVKSAIQELKNNDILPVIATGRSVIEVVDVMKESGIDSIVALNGMYIESHGEVIYQDIMETELVQRFIDFSHSLGNEVCMYNGYHFWATKVTSSMEKAYKHINALPPAELPENHLTENVNMLLALTENVEDDAKYFEVFPELGFFRNSAFSIDTVRKGNDKGFGVARILEHLGHTDIPTYGFGDGPNDIPLLKAVDHGVAMENGVDATKKVAEFVTKKNTEDGLIHTFKHFNLIRENF
jgi:Cof subfamily protein (haloacid dehalogenase superfamily)